ncbi:CDPK-related protein kinase [Linum perenne]
MGGCASKPPPKSNPYAPRNQQSLPEFQTPDNQHSDQQPPLPSLSPFFPLYTPSPSRATPMRIFKFHPPSPAKHIRAVLRKRKSKKKPAKAEGDENVEEDEEEGEGVELDRRFGFSKELRSKLEVGEEVGRGHFGYTCSARFRKGDRKGQQVAVKVIPKSKMNTSIAVEDVRREVKILKALAGHSNLVQFYDAFEDSDNVYIVMELCTGGELLDRILSRGGKYPEDDAKAVMVQILNVVAFCHLQGVVHRDLKPENFLYTSKEENSHLKVIDFGLSDYVRPDERLNDIVGSAYYVAPEVLHRSYSTEADVWSIGVIAYILLCGSRPFWARTESGIFRAVLKANPNFNEASWTSVSPEAKDFVKRLLHKDPRKRMTAAQGLNHPWLRNSTDVKVLLDISILKLMKAYIRSSPLRKTALRALMKNATEAMRDSRIPDILASLNTLQHRKMEFEEFCSAAVSVHQLEALDGWEHHARSAYELFDKDGNRAIIIQELASELGLGPSIPVHAVLNDWIRHTDGKLSFHGFVKLLHGISSRAMTKAP